MSLRIEKLLEGLEDSHGEYYVEVVGNVPSSMPYLSLILLGPKGSPYEGEVIEWELCFKVSSFFFDNKILMTPIKGGEQRARLT